MAEEAPQGPQRTPNPPKRGPLALRNMAKEEEKAGEQAEKALKKTKKRRTRIQPRIPSELEREISAGDSESDESEEITYRHHVPFERVPCLEE